MARRKVPKEPPLGPPVTLKNHRFSWCIDNYHDRCRVQFTYYEKTYICNCNCHEEKQDGKSTKAVNKRSKV